VTLSANFGVAALELAGVAGQIGKADNYQVIQREIQPN